MYVSALYACACSSGSWLGAQLAAPCIQLTASEPPTSATPASGAPPSTRGRPASRFGMRMAVGPRPSTVGVGTGLLAGGALLFAADPASFGGAAALLGARADASAGTPGRLCSALQALSASAQSRQRAGDQRRRRGVRLGRGRTGAEDSRRMGSPAVLAEAHEPCAA